jgi:two-component sensor histidine kinase
MPTIEQPSLSDWDLTHLRAAIDAAGVGLWHWNVESDAIGLDQRAMALWDLHGATVTSFSELSGKIHPTDIDRVRAAFAATRAIVGAYEIDFRILSGDDIRWVSARGQGDDADIRDGVMRGIFLDVTRRKYAEESHQLLAGEMSHRVQNLLLVACALAEITSRAAKTTQDMAQDLTQRLMALGRAHDVVRPRGGQPVQAALLGDLLAVLLQAYDESDGASGRITIAVPRLDLSEAAATSLALVVHELATNSAKYGALSADTGRLVLVCHEEGDEVKLVWNESGGPPPLEEARHTGFGSVMTDRVIKQIDGSITRNWTDQGLIVTLRMNKALLGV